MNTDNGNKINLFNYFKSLATCILLLLSYIVSLYVWKSEHGRNHPSTIKQRFRSVFIVTVVSPFFVYFSTSQEVFKKTSLWELIGFRLSGILEGLTIPLLLTATLFLGPIVSYLFRPVVELTSSQSQEEDGFTKLLIVSRNIIVAPFSEEFAFRACMIAILRQSFSPWNSVALSASLFGLAHMHHLYEYINMGVEMKTAVIVIMAQCTYTMLFGAYSGYIFVQTGHILSAILAHSFCNFMGFPQFSELMNFNKSARGFVVTVAYFLGLFAWILLLRPLTNPQLYSNDLLERLT